MYINFLYNYEDFMIYSFIINVCNINKDIYNFFLLNYKKILELFLFSFDIIYKILKY